jgi:hypothetical protein
VQPKEFKDTVEQTRLSVLWFGILAGPMAMLIQLQANYALELLACDLRQKWFLHLVALLALVISASSALLSWSAWRRAGSSWEEDGDGGIPRIRFMAGIGILMGVLFSLTIIAQWIPIFIYSPCLR